MLNLAHTPYTKKKILSTHSKWSEGDVYEIYWNIKFNHGMESINNNFRLKQRGKKWLDGWRRAKRKSNELMLGKRLWAGMMMMRSKPHSRDLKLSSSGKKKYENINIVCCCSYAWNNGQAREHKACNVKHHDVYRCISNPKDMLFCEREIHLTIPFQSLLFYSVCEPMRHDIKSVFLRNLIVIIIRYVLAH